MNTIFLIIGAILLILIIYSFIGSKNRTRPGKLSHNAPGRKSEDDGINCYDSEKIEVENTETGVKTVYNSRDELPPDLRENVKMMEEKFENGDLEDFEDTSISYTDSDGNEGTYKSFDEMPENIRNELIKDRQQLKSAVKSGAAEGSFTYTDNDGIERTFSSLDEMPSKIRQHFEKELLEK